ncbi:aminotransferase class I/II-fold pyridoxal phosphate-dependent enzyme, partial [Raoultella terrigena]|uniref:aminotransferase class I/II-fold pyridoxal phosphate-dependent enzyme n=1 Tax=Raoultella terrigena TaxID=577 RepID=UPI00133020CD
ANTKLLIVESPSNPLAELVDITALSEIAHAHGAMLVVDNCFRTPALQQPLKLGADIVFHSATKFIDGQGRCMGGVVAGRAEQMKEVVGFLRTAGPTLSPFNAWIFTKGLETLRLRMRAHCESAQLLAEWLEQQEGVE